MKRKYVIKYAIFLLGLGIILIYTVSQGKNINWNNLNDYESAIMSGKLGQSLLWMWMGWGAIYFSALGIYKGFKKRKSNL